MEWWVRQLAAGSQVKLQSGDNFVTTDVVPECEGHCFYIYLIGSICSSNPFIED